MLEERGEDLGRQLEEEDTLQCESLQLFRQQFVPVIGRITATRKDGVPHFTDGERQQAINDDVPHHGSAAQVTHEHT